jgi:hypothetical protein
MFDTETMAELCFKQGHVDQAVGIYQRLLAEADDPVARARYAARMAALGQMIAGLETPGLETPGLRVEKRDGQIEIEWRLPVEVERPVLQVLIVRRTAQGIEADRRTIALGAPRGKTSLPAADLYDVRAAAGHLRDEVFVPMVRFPDRVV